MVRKITIEEVKDSVKKNKITQVTIRQCSICGYMMHYFIKVDQVSIDTCCDCVTYGSFKISSWEDLADTVNAQSVDKWRKENALKLGIVLEDE